VLAEARARSQQARAHCGLASACQVTGDSGQARSHGQQALARYTDLGIPEAEQVRAEITAAAGAQREPPASGSLALASARTAPQPGLHFIRERRSTGFQS
jgi:hypothetical protein